MRLTPAVQLHRDPSKPAPAADEPTRSPLQASLRGMDYASGAAALAPATDAPSAGAPVQFFGGIGGAIKGAVKGATSHLNPGGGAYAHLGGRAGIMAIQRGLAKEGFDPGPADGLVGPATKRAVRDFQKAKGLTVDGIIGKETLEALGLMPKGAPIRQKQGGGGEQEHHHGGLFGGIFDAAHKAAQMAKQGGGGAGAGGEQEHRHGGLFGGVFDAAKRLGSKLS